MKLGLLSLAAASATLLGLVSGTEAVAPVYLTHDVPLGDALDLDSGAFFDGLLKYTNVFCKNPDHKIRYIVADKVEVDNSVSQGGATYPWVTYGDDSDGDNVPIAANCENVLFESVGDVSLSELIEGIKSEDNENTFVVVQQKPVFSVVSEEEEVEESFADQLLLHKDISIDEKFKRTSSNSTKGTESLFTDYQFFTPGILSCLILSFFLVFVLYVAVSWMASIEITYLAFDKQVDYNKKVE